MYCHLARSGPSTGRRRSCIWSSSTAQNGWILAVTSSAAKRAMSSGWIDLDVGDVVPMIAGDHWRSCGLDDVEREPHGTVADGMEVRLEPTPIQLDDGLAEHIRIQERHAASSSTARTAR